MAGSCPGLHDKQDHGSNGQAEERHQDDDGEYRTLSTGQECGCYPMWKCNFQDSKSDHLHEEKVSRSKLSQGFTNNSVQYSREDTSAAYKRHYISGTQEAVAYCGISKRLCEISTSSFRKTETSVSSFYHKAVTSFPRMSRSKQNRSLSSAETTINRDCPPKHSNVHSHCPRRKRRKVRSFANFSKVSNRVNGDREGCDGEGSSPENILWTKKPTGECECDGVYGRRVGIGRVWTAVLWAVMVGLLASPGEGRTVRTKYGDVSGVIVTPANRYLDAVEVFKGVPYASPPVGSLRFMPPVTGAVWTGVRMANRFSPVCPQRLPDLRNETEALRRMPRGRLEFLRRVSPMLANQSEDCLYLNIYAPAHAAAGMRGPTVAAAPMPVLVFVHGESYLWGAASLYDGSVLASYGRLIVVTVNYRLGVLGFLNANSGPANYGLMDQLAALHWVQENIASFGGDPANVTLMGHGAGATCVHFLMTSTAVPDGVLFQRVVLMSGTALCPWALAREPVRYARQLARHADCPPDRGLLECLRGRPLDVLQSAPVDAPQFVTAYGPSVDGIIIGGRTLGDKLDESHPLPPGPGPVHFHNFLNLNNAGFRRTLVAKMSRYPMMVGVVRLESYFSFTAEDVQYGIEADRKARIIRTFVRNTYRYHLSEILATIINEYTDWERPVQHPINIRDETVDALSDATVVAPLVHTAELHSRQPTFMYVFDYQTRLSDYPQKQGCVHGEELAYVLGAPLVSGMTPFPRNYSKAEIQLSEATMDYWTNFITTGNPNQGTKTDLPLGMHMERHKLNNLEWLPYDKIHKRYLNLDVKPKMKNHYRAHRLSFWLNLVPDLHRPGGEDVPHTHHQLDNEDRPHQVVQPVPKKPQVIMSPARTEGPTDKSYANTTQEPPHPVIVVASSSSKSLRKQEGFSAYSKALSLTIVVGCSLLALNVIIFILMFYQRNHGKRRARNPTSGADRKLENGGPMATICVTSGATELSTVETILTPSPILRDSSSDLRLLVLPSTPSSPQPIQLSSPDQPPPLPPKVSKLSTPVATETQPLLSTSVTHLISTSPLGPITEEESFRV